MKRVNNSASFNVWVPSIAKDISFLEINTSQQKRLIKSIIDSPIFNSQFIKTAYAIIKENCVEDGFDVSTLNILDKMFILIKLRSISISNDLEAEFTSENNSDIKYTTKVQLDKLIEKATKQVKNIKAEEIVYNSYTLGCSVPDILCELKMEEEFKEHADVIEINDVEELRKNFGEKFICELCKYINTITINEGEEPYVCNMVEYTFTERISIIENLPAKLIEDVLLYINKINGEIEKVSLIKKSATINGKKEEVEYQLSLDATFFTSS